ncbi:Gfo/Idh/MocA family oxidoreductase [Deinococcus sonorensis]|uniref:Gfo/Idh/MocA family oxidoreductase n=2 Tax=Deinococcus sonorensis TaxID=309891 RepID=A0AAU7UEK1_9DEIO
MPQPDPTTPRSEPPPPGPPLRLIHLGLGGWGRDWMKVVRANGDVQTAAFVDSSPQALQLAAQQGADPALCFSSLTEALQAVQADVALITASAPGHTPLALEALAAGLPVLIEKPFAPTLQEARQVVEAGRQADRSVMISQNYRFFPAPQLAAQLVRERRFGELGFAEVDFRRDSARSRPPATGHHQLPQPLLMDMAIHHFDLMRFVLGREPLAITCHAFNPPWSPFRDPASAAATIEFEGGLVVSYRGSWASSGVVTPWAGEWRMDAAEGEIRWTSRDDPPPDRVTARRLGEPAADLTLPAVAHLDRAGSLAEFVSAVRAGREPASSGQENLLSLALALAAVQSAQEGRTVALSEVVERPGQGGA